MVNSWRVQTVIIFLKDVTSLRATYPHDQLNHLSVDEKRNHFGGIVSVMPLAMDCARAALRRIEVTRVYRPDKSIKKSKSQQISVSDILIMFQRKN